MTKYEGLMVEAEKLRAAGRRARDHRESARLMERAAEMERKAKELSVAEGGEDEE